MRRLAVRSLALSLLAVLPFLSGCGNFFVYPGSTTTGTGSGTSTTSFAYVANATTLTLAGFALASGSLAAVTGSPYALPLSPTSAVVTPANTFLYVGCLGAIYGYSIASTGQLTPLSSGSAVAVATAVSMDVSPDGNWLFILDASGITIDEYAINTTTGALTAATGASFAVTGGVTLPRQVKVSPNGAYVFAAMGTGGDIVFTFNTTTGALTEAQSLAGSATTSDNALAIDSTSTHLYIARSGDGSGVAAFTIGASGALTSIAGSPFAAGATPYSVVLDSTGAYLYAANRTDGTISGYAITATGVLTALTGSPYATGLAPVALGRDGTGKYILSAAFSGSPDLTMYSFDTTTAGKLDSASTSTTGSDPTGAFALATTH